MRRTLIVLAMCAAVLALGVKFGDVAWAQAKEGAKALFDFEDAKEAESWEAVGAEASVVQDHATSGKSALKVVLKPGDYPGISTTKIAADWSACGKLVFDVFADADFNLLVRIDDQDSKDYGSRFNLDENQVTKGKNTVTIDLVDVGGKIDLKKVKMLVLFGAGTQQDTTFYLDNVRLEK